MADDTQELERRAEDLERALEAFKEARADAILIAAQKIDDLSDDHDAVRSALMFDRLVQITAPAYEDVRKKIGPRTMLY